jgi:UTP--glucose-1-phosphate uridylyltransferase
MNSHRIIKRAVFPVAGLGTRFLPATKASPKEMLPIVDKPLIQYAVEEAAAAGITEMIFVTGRNKRAIEDHFDKAYELEVELATHQKYELLGILRAIKPDNVQCFYVRQPEALGLGHAILCAERLLNDQPFAVILADDLLNGSVPVMQQMMAKFKQTGNSIAGVEHILPEQTRSYGVVGGMAYDDKLLKLHSIIEKPEPQDAPSDMGVIGRYILTPSIFDYLRTLLPGFGEELQLTDAIAEMLKHETVLAYQFEGKRYDCGSKLGYLEATVEFALRHPEVKEKFRHLLKEIIYEDGSELVDIPPDIHPYMRPMERMVAWTEY